MGYRRKRTTAPGRDVHFVYIRVFATCSACIALIGCSGIGQLIMKAVGKSEVPRPMRLTLVNQAVDYIRHGLDTGRWRDVMPSEGELCRELGISRGTIRNALGVLFQEERLRPAGRGGRHRIEKSGTGNRAAVSGHLVRVLSPQPRFIIAELTQTIFQTMSESLGRAGLHLEFGHHKGLWNLRKPEAALRKITAQPDTVGWVLYRSSQPVQEWFARSGLPAVVLGGIFPGVALSRMEFDLAAASRHAAGVFAARGHRRMVFVSVEQATAGDHASAAAFVSAAAAAGAHAEVITFDDTIPGLCHLLDGLLLAKPVPTAYFVACPNHVHATIGHLTRRGFGVPKHAAVISRMDALLLGESIPSVARYRMNAERLGRGGARLLLRAILPEHSGVIGKCVVMPEFVDGESAGGPPEF
jgi:DNA-binding LacI/PurR family transcriptional regulator